MWLLIKMSGKWYAVNHVDEDGLRDHLDNVFDHVNDGNVICIADDLESWCNEMDVQQDEVTIVEAE